MVVIGASWLSVGAAQGRLTPYARSLYGRKSELRLAHRRNAHRSSHFYPAPSADEIDNMVAVSANKFQIDPQFVHAIIKVESAYNTNAVSHKGAKGLMQLMPEIARRFGVKNAFNPRQNIAGGVAYLKHLFDLFSGDVALTAAAYNAGPNAVLRRGGIPNFPETIDYVRKVTSLYSHVSLVDLVAPLFTKSIG